MTYEIKTRPQNGMVIREMASSRANVLALAKRISKLHNCVVDGNIYDGEGNLIAQATFYAGEVIL